MGGIALLQGGRLLAYKANEPSKALPYFKESRRLFVTFKNDHFVAACNSQIAHIQRLLGALDDAEEAYRETLIHFHRMGHRPAIAHELECLAFIAQARHVPQRTARLFGAAETLRELIGAAMLPHEQEEYDQSLAALKQELNPGVLQQAWIAGSIMDLDQAVDYALAG